MKSLSNLHGLFLALMLSLAFASCKKDDTTLPVVTLVGNNPMQVDLGGSFTDPGATANDDVSGDLTDAIVVTGSVNANLASTYTLTYSATDEAGNTGTATRTVNVAATRANYVGTFSCVENCPSPYGLSSTSTFSAGTGANQVVISPFYFNGGSLTLTVDGNDVVVDAGQNPNPLGEGVTGSGTLNAAGTVITMNLTFTPGGGAPVSCVSTYTKN